MSRIEAAFAGEPAFVPYLAVGDPNYDDSLRYVEALAEGGADVIELGLPFSEPIAEGPTIQEAVVRSLDAGMTPDRYFQFVEEVAVEVPLVCMTYYNLIYQYGDERGPRPFVRRAAQAGISGFVVPDLPAEEADPMRAACDEFDVDLISIVAPTTGDDRLDRLAELSSGYLYVQARLGTTGTDVDAADRTAESLDRLADYEVPKAVGFGIDSGDRAETVVTAGADGVIVGSALVEIVADGYEAGDPPAEVADRLRSLTAELKQGAVRGAGVTTEL